MAQKKRLQVFVSSTFTDLKEERQAAVEAILKAGRIPAGMELFTAGDESQLEVIKRWIDESDVYLLILGGRYGSLEPKTGKSYTQLEYEYAIQKEKPFFAIVITEKFLNEKVQQYGLDMIERERNDLLKSFREQVLSKMVSFYSHTDGIKLAIYETMSEFSRREDLVGWVPGDQAVNGGAVAEEMARLVKDNESLRLKVTATETIERNFAGLTFEDMYRSLLNETLEESDFDPNEIQELKQVAATFGNQEPSVIDYLWWNQKFFQEGTEPAYLEKKYVEVLLLHRILVEKHYNNYTLTDDVGKPFILRLRLKPEASNAKNFLHQ